MTKFPVVGGGFMEERAEGKVTVNQLPGVYTGPRDGVTDNSAQLAALTSPVRMMAGTYLVNSNTTVNPMLMFDAGAVLKPANGVTVTLAGGLQAPPTKIFDMSTGGTVLLPRGDAHAHWWGALPNTDSTTALQWAITSLAYQTGSILSNAHCRQLQFEEGLYKVSAAFTFNSPMKLRGRSSRGSVIQITDTFPASSVLLTWTNVSASADLLWEESHLPAGGLESIGFDGNGRNIAAHAFRFQKCDRMQFNDVMVRNFKGSVITGSSFRESQFWALRTWACGSSSSPYAPVVDLWDDATGGADGHNLIQFNSCQFALSCGDHARYGTDSTLIIVRGVWFNECVFHGLNDSLQTYTDNYGHNGDQTLPFVDGEQQGRHVCANARNIFYSGCRFILPGRGQPVFQMQQSAAGASSINGVYVGGGNVLTARTTCAALSLATINTAADTITVAGITLPNSTVVAPHYLQTGARVQFAAGVGGTLPSPLAPATDYYAIVIDANTFQVATTRANAFVPTPIDITTVGVVGTTANSVAQQDLCFTANASTDVVTAANHRLSTGARLQVASTGTLPAGLAAATDYFFIRTGNGTGKLATTRANADAGTAIDITDAGTGIHFINPVHFFCNVEQGVLGIGSPQQLEGVPTRGWARVETNGTFRWDFTTLQASTLGGVVPAELASGSLNTYFKGGVVLLDNTAAFWGTQNDGTTNVQLATVSSANVTNLANTTNNTVVQGSGIVDLTTNTGGHGVRVQNGVVGFNGSAAVAKPTITGSRSGATATVLGSVLTALANVGLITDSTTA